MTKLGTTQAKLALVVDDSPIQRRVLSRLLEEEGYRVCSAYNGENAVEMYISQQPELVLMDINMPVMNGYEAAKKIKKLSTNTLCPMVFITSMNTDESFIDAINAGGDGILVRPFSPAVFKAKIKSIQRLSNMFLQLKHLQSEQQKDAELAEQLMSGVIEARNYALDRIGIIKKPAELFSGDIQLTALSPNGNINVLLGDFTGHGLRSSIGAIPLAQTFRTMTKKGFLLLDIIQQINIQLSNLLPPDLFLAAAFVSISSHDNSVYVFNAGLPDCYIFDQLGQIKVKISSNHPAIGVLPSLLPDTGIEVFNVEASDYVVLLSDGILDARNNEGEMYESQRFEQAALEGILSQDVCETVLASVNQFCGNMPQEDDISLITVPCGGWKTAPVHVNQEESDIVLVDTITNDANLEQNIPSWSWNLSLTGIKLASVNPIPLAINQINEIEDNQAHWQNLYTILTELFVNALDHGVLGLSSDLKHSAEGFAEYYSERERRLAELTSGFIHLSIEYFSMIKGGKVKLVFKDSGEGFDIDKYQQERLEKPMENNVLSGRGIKLIDQLCKELTYSENGTKVEAYYVW